MRRSFKRMRLVIVTAMLLTSCLSREQESPSASRDASFSVEEAKTVFERSLVVTRGGGRKGPFGDMEFTPEWKRASFGRGRRSIELYRVPILTKNVYSCIRGEYQEGLSQIRTDRLHQRLIVVKDIEKGISCCYLETAIPTARVSVQKSFSGIRLYTEIAGGCIVGVYKYRRGVRVDGVFLPGEPMTRTLREAHTRALLSGFRLVSGMQIETRSEDWSYEDQGYYDLGGGFFWGDDGYVYYDTDGDGIPDSMWIDPLEFSGGDNPGWGGDDPWMIPGVIN